MKTEQIIQELDKIAAKHGGVLEPEHFVAEASKPKHPLHSLFDWDVDKAAHRDYIRQARKIIVSVEYQVRTETRILSVPVYVRDPRKEGNEAGYRSLQSIKTDADMKHETLVAEFKRVGALLARARSIAEALELEAEVDAIIDQLQLAQQRVTAWPERATQ